MHQRFSSLASFLQRQVQQDGFRSMASTQLQRGHNPNWGNSMNGLNYETAEPLRIEAPPPLNGGEYTPVSVTHLVSK
jgi:hypothetical protein